MVVEGAGDLGELAEDRFSPQAAAVLVVPLAERPRGGLQLFDFPHPESARTPLSWNGGGRDEPAFEAVEEGSAGYRGTGEGAGEVPSVHHKITPGEVSSQIHGGVGPPRDLLCV